MANSARQPLTSKSKNLPSHDAESRPPKRCIIYSDDEDDTHQQRHIRNRRENFDNEGSRSHTRVRDEETNDYPSTCIRHRSENNMQDSVNGENGEDEPHELGSKSVKYLLSQMCFVKSQKGALDTWNTAAHFIPKALGPFVNILQVLQIGSKCDGVDKNDWDLSKWPNIDKDEAKTLFQNYRTLLGIIPGLSNLILKLDDDPDELIYVANFLTRKARSARTDDLSNIKKNVLKFIPDLQHIGQIDADHPKEQHGFHHPATGCLLCPRRIFCRDAIDGKIDIIAGDFPSMIYPENGYNPAAIDENALQNDFLASCFRCLFTGPSTGKRPQNSATSSKTKGSGRNPIAVTYSMKGCNKYNIAYVATLARFAVNSQAEWTEDDGNFHLEEYFNNLLMLFEDPEWCDNTLAWYDAEVFGKGTCKDRDDSKYAGPSSINVLAQQRAARRAAHRQMSTPPPSTESAASEADGVGDSSEREDN